MNTVKLAGPMLFLSTLSLRRATELNKLAGLKLVFLSTLSLRRATEVSGDTWARGSNFYPRSPCGERRNSGTQADPAKSISIHALLAESDVFISTTITCTASFLSTLSLRRATSRPRRGPDQPRISIHALLAESDTGSLFFFDGRNNFYPRSPCGERPSITTITICIALFLSTLSLRRATAKVHKTVGHFCAYGTNFMGIASSC